MSVTPWHLQRMHDASRWHIALSIEVQVTGFKLPSYQLSLTESFLYKPTQLPPLQDAGVYLGQIPALP